MAVIAAGTEQAVAVAGYEAFLLGSVAMAYLYPVALFQGRSETTLAITLPRNALVDDWQLLVQAKRVDATLLQQVAQVRAYDTTSSHELVIDFGTARTVSGITLPGNAQVKAVHAWLGTQFGPVSAFAPPAAGTSDAVFPELRTERLRVVLSRTLTGEELAAASLRLPEPPSGLSISIDGGPPVWQHVEPVQPRANVTTPDALGWDTQSRRIVPISAPLAALAGDPLGDEAGVGFILTLRTAVPCVLALATSGTPRLRRVRRLRFGTETSTRTDFTSEGRIDLPLLLPTVPTPRRIDAVSWLAEAVLPAERVLPPLGPEPASASGVPVLAELLVDAARAVAVRLPAGSGLATLTALRLPLAADGDGAELRVVLWSADPAQPDGAPLAPLAQGSSTPLTLAAAAPGDPEAWLRFDLTEPQTLNDSQLPWLVLVAARGSARWALGGEALPGDASGALVMPAPRRGPPNGPFKALPQPLQSAAGVIDARARLRLVGLAPKAMPMAPLDVQLGDGPSVAVTPTAKGATGSLVPPGGISSVAPLLQLTSRVAGSINWRDIDVVSDI